MKMRLLLLIMGMSVTAVQAAEPFVLTQEQWSRPKRVETVLRMPAIKGVLAAIDQAPGGRLLIHYPGGDEGTLWAYELQAWLVSLGVASQRIELRPGSSAPTSIEMQVELPLSAKIGQSEHYFGSQVVKQE